VRFEVRRLPRRRAIEKREAAAAARAWCDRLRFELASRCGVHFRTIAHEALSDFLVGETNTGQGPGAWSGHELGGDRHRSGGACVHEAGWHGDTAYAERDPRRAYRSERVAGERVMAQSCGSHALCSAARMSVAAYALSALAGVLKVNPCRQLEGASG
jgi:hypothetical protein